MLTTSFKDKDFFFDRPAVQAAIRAARQDPERLKFAGAVVRRQARTSMRKVKKKTTIAAPGQPPRSRADEPNLRTILFAWSPQQQLMVVGPVLLSGSHVRGATVPQVHEFGGVIQVPLLKIATAGRRRGSGRKATPKQLRALRRLAQQGTLLRPARRIVWRNVRYPARPFMRPALDHAAKKLPEIWQNSFNQHFRSSGSAMVRKRAA